MQRDYLHEVTNKWNLNEASNKSIKPLLALLKVARFCHQPRKTKVYCSSLTVPIEWTHARKRFWIWRFIFHEFRCSESMYSMQNILNSGDFEVSRDYLTWKLNMASWKSIFVLAESFFKDILAESWIYIYTLLPSRYIIIWSFQMPK